MRRWAVLVLPGLLLRSLIPVGFMPTFGPGFSVGLMLCPAYAPLAATSPDEASNQRSASRHDAASMEMSEGMDMPMDIPDAGNATTPSPHSLPANGWGQDHTLCPYAASALLAGPAAPHSLAVYQTPETERTPLAPQNAYVHVTRRAHAARAPPLPT